MHYHHRIMVQYMINTANEIVKKIPFFLSKNPFVSNVLKLMTGSTLGYLTLLLALPLLSRIYTPEDFGLFGIFWIVSISISAISTGGYEYAIILPKEDKDAANLLAVSVLCICAVSGLCLLIILFIENTLVRMFAVPNLVSILRWIPFMILNLGLFNVLNFWLTRKKAFSKISAARFIQQFSIAAVQLTIGYMISGTSTGLVIGVILGQLVACIFLGWLALSNGWKGLYQNVSFKAMLWNMKRYRKFPRYHFFSFILSGGSEQIPFLFLAYFFNSLAVGWYTLTYKVLTAPADFISKAVTPVFIQRINEKKIEGDSAISVIISTIKYLVLLGVLPMLGFILLAPSFFAVFFGEPWRSAGEYAQIIAPAYFLKFILYPISSVIEVYERLRFRFWEQLLHFFLVVFSFGVGGLLGSTKISLALYTILFTIRSVILIYFIITIGRQPFQSDKDIPNTPYA